MPTGTALRDARHQLFDAAERVLVRDGLGAVTSRTVTAEAGCAKGVLHRYFADFDAFLAELVMDRTAQVADLAARLRAQAGTGTVAANLAEALMGLFGPVALAVVSLVATRDGVRARLRTAGLTGIPLLSEGSAMVVSYLAAEQAVGRVAAGADLATLAPTLIGAVHLLYAEEAGLTTAAVEKVVTTVVTGVI